MPPPPSPGRARSGRPAAVRGRLRPSAPSTDVGIRPRIEKYTSKMVSNAFQWALFFTRVAASAYLNASRSSSGMWRTASMASRFSVRLTGIPALRSSLTKPASDLQQPGRGGMNYHNRHRFVRRVDMLAHRYTNNRIASEMGGHHF